MWALNFYLFIYYSSPCKKSWRWQPYYVVAIINRHHKIPFPFMDATNTSFKKMMYPHNTCYGSIQFYFIFRKKKSCAHSFWIVGMESILLDQLYNGACSHSNTLIISPPVVSYESDHQWTNILHQFFFSFISCRGGCDCGWMDVRVREKKREIKYRIVSN